MAKKSIHDRADRLYDLLRLLRGGGVQRAGDLAARLGVSTRTIYRDVERLAASGVPVTGTRGTGYVLAQDITLPPLTLTAAEIEALNLSLAVLAEAADDDLRTAATSLSAKLDAALPTEALSDADAWKTTFSPFADASRTLSHLPLLRSAIKVRQKVVLTYTGADGTVTRRVIRPLRTAYVARSWTLTAWCELREGLREFRLDLIESADALPELFVEDPDTLLSGAAPAQEVRRQPD
ncbi:helix-turn-helix transcriptional regulator [Sulfitobacter sp. JB4-11]|uniref:helix-turn-helix transcriptional regulator n=1 Tax=Sulfitobacter rhodophyticola TaxID=3238304 RepID=UPI0035112C95